MSKLNNILFFFVLPVLGVLLYPPSTLLTGWVVAILAVAMFVALGFLMLRGRSLALTFSIFVQGMNVIIRLMMFFSNGFSSKGVPDFLFMITCLAGLAISGWLLLRLDRQDVRLGMIH